MDHDVQVSTLSNGVRIISQDRHGIASYSGIYSKYGSRDEPSPYAGINHFIGSMLYQSTLNRETPVRVVRDLAHNGTHVVADFTREHIAFSVESLREDALEAFDIASDLFTNGQFRFWEVNDRKAAVLESIKAGVPTSQTALLDSLHHAAYGNQSLGKPIYASEVTLNNIASHESLTSWRNLILNPTHLVVSAVDIPHDLIVEKANKELGHLLPLQETIAPRSKSQYCGGDMKQSVQGDPLVHFILAFEGPGMVHEDFVALCTLNMLMGGGGSFSAGGPGKGMYSRLYRNILSRYGWVDSAECVVSLNSDSSLFGVQCIAPGEYGGRLVGEVGKELHKMATKLSNIEVERAKKQIKSAMFMNLESRAILCEDLAKHMLVYNKRLSPQELAEKVDNLTVDKLQKVAQTMLQSNVTLVSAGDVREIPSYHSVARMFQ